MNTPSVILQAYPDHIQPVGAESCLRALARFVDRLLPGIDALHLLPPYVSGGDFGFAVADYEQIDPVYGDWGDLAKLSATVPLVLDFVVNHVSSQHPWFVGYLAGDPRYADFFITLDPSWDLTNLGAHRPRSGLPVSTYTAAAGPVSLWTWYGAGQPDLNYRNPRVVAAMAEQLRAIVARTGANIRLDSIAWTFKNPGRRSIHTDDGFALAARLARAGREAAPGTWVAAEVDDDLPPEHDYRRRAGADAVYRYALPALIAHAMLTGTPDRLRDWLAALPEHRWATGINFTATHDGIYLRPTDPPLPAADINFLAARTAAKGGRIQRRGESVHELNTTFGDLLSEPTGRRHVAAQALALTLPGTAQIYLPSLFGLPYDAALAKEHDNPRVGNRVKQLDLAALLAEPSSQPARIFERIVRLLRHRAAYHETFDPHAPFGVLDLPGPLLGYTRGHGQTEITVVINLTDTAQQLPATLAHHIDVLNHPNDSPPDKMGPYQVRWLRHRPG